MIEDLEWLKRRYLDDGLTMRQIAAEAGCSYQRVRDALRAQGVPTRPRGGARSPIAAGERYGRWVTVREVGSNKHHKRVVLCWCDCGGEGEVDYASLRSGKSQSCGCLKTDTTAARNRARSTHGHTRQRKPSPTYISWQNMIARCYHPTTRSFEHYGGRGVTVWERWRGPGGFEVFLADMGQRPEGKTLDRIDPNGDYRPDNCRWATASEQQLNRR